MVNAGARVRVMVRARVWVLMNARARISFRVRVRVTVNARARVMFRVRAGLRLVLVLVLGLG